MTISKFDRRAFLFKGATGVAVASAIPYVLSQPVYAAQKIETVDSVSLGSTGLKVSRIAFGTGTRGWKRESDQTRIGVRKFVELSQYCYDKGIRFFDAADMYGSHSYVGEGILKSSGSLI